MALSHLGRFLKKSSFRGPFLTLGDFTPFKNDVILNAPSSQLLLFLGNLFYHSLDPLLPSLNHLSLSWAPGKE